MSPEDSSVTSYQSHSLINKAGQMETSTDMTTDGEKGPHPTLLQAQTQRP